MTKKITFNQRGFTVVELLVATVVFGIVLLVITVAILQFSRVYYKGVTEANTQETARTIVDRIAQSIQFNGGVVTITPPRPPGAGSPASPQSFCVGNQQYTYVVGLQLTDSAPIAGQNQSWHTLVVRDLAGCTATSGKSVMNAPATSGQELLSPGMRLSKMKVESLGGNLYKVSVRIVSGLRELVVNDTAENARCQTAQAGTTGTQFCAMSDISTVIVKRVE